MPNSRTISPEAWGHAREALVFYFSRRNGSSQAEDLAQETLAAIWERDDFEFEKDEDFLRVCMGFARRISQAGFRDQKRHSGKIIQSDISAPTHHSDGARATESRILLEDILDAGKLQLREKDWELIQFAANLNGEDGQSAQRANHLHASDANKFRVYLFRARKKLAEATGWHSS
jgi:DNA-directed RNA polymerase specialized sigma24 family protein